MYIIILSIANFTEYLKLLGSISSELFIGLVSIVIFSVYLKLLVIKRIKVIEDSERELNQRLSKILEQVNDKNFLEVNKLRINNIKELQKEVNELIKLTELKNKSNFFQNVIEYFGNVSVSDHKKGSLNDKREEVKNELN